MNFDFTPEQLEIKDSFIRFAQKELSEGIQERDQAGEFNRAGWKQCADIGIMGMPFPEKFGGSEQDIVSTTLAMEGLGYGCEDRGLLFSLNAQMWSIQTPLVEFGTPEQQEMYLPGLIDGSIIGAHGMSEPSSGSDTFSMRTTAIKDGEYYVINGL